MKQVLKLLENGAVIRFERYTLKLSISGGGLQYSRVLRDSTFCKLQEIGAITQSAIKHDCFEYVAC